VSAAATMDTKARYWDGVARGYIPGPELRIGPDLRLHRGQDTDVDPITFEVIRYALLNANFEHCRLIQRLSVSPIVMITRDAQASLLLEDGDLVFLGPNVQYFSNCQSLTVKWIIENRSGSPGINPGDIFLCNDPYIGTPHQPDTCLALPLFVGDELFCWVTNTLHYADVGGSSPGSFCIAARDAWDDPPAFPAVKLVEQGATRCDLEEIFIRQSRLRPNVLMDLRAAVAAVQIIGKRVAELVERYGPEGVKSVMRRIVQASENLFADRLRHVPDGKWSARGYVESCVPGDAGIYRYQVNIAKTGERLFVDNRGTDRQAGAINITFAAFAGCVLTALAQSIVPDLAGAFGGAYRRVTFQPEAGLLNCAEFPAAVSPSGAVTSEMNIHLATQAAARMLASGDSDARARILGAPQPAFYSGIYAGLDENGKPFIAPSSDNMVGTLGAMPDRDGVDAGGHYWIPGGIAENVEQVESYYPVLYLYRRFQPGGPDGAGRTRGGLGLVVGLTPWRARHFEFALATNESFTRANGMLGGNPGTRGWTRIINGTTIQDCFHAGAMPQGIDGLGGAEVMVSPKATGLPVVENAVFEWSGSTTSGFGDPLSRDPAACLADVHAGLFEPSAIEAVYGVVLRNSLDERRTHTVDVVSTKTKRLRMRSERLGRAACAEPQPPRGAVCCGDALAHCDGRWVCGNCAHDLGPMNSNYKSETHVRRDAIQSFGPALEPSQAQIANQMEFRMFLCSNCGVRFDTEIARREDPMLHDIRIEHPSN